MVPCESEYRQLGGTDDDEEAKDVDHLAQTEWVSTFFSIAPLPKEASPSQLGGAQPRRRTPLRGSRHLFLTRLVVLLARPFHQSHSRTRSTTLGRPRLQSDVAGGEGTSTDASSVQVVAC